MRAIQMITQPKPNPPPLMEKSSSKVGFVRRAKGAQRVAPIELTTIGQLIPSTETSPIPIQPSGDTSDKSPSPKVAITHEYGKPGRPKNPQQLSLPSGFHALRKGRSEYSDEYAEQFIDAYYRNGASVTRTCRETNTRYSAFRVWLQERPAFAEAIREVEEIIQDEIHSQFMTRVLNEWEPNPAWKFKYFNKNFPEYSENKKSMKVVFNLKDTLIRPTDVVDAEIVEKNESGPKQLMEAPTDPA